MSEAIATALGAAGIVLFAGGALVLAPYLQLDDAQATPGLSDYTELEAQGRDIYVSQGCVYCHSQQPRDPGQAPDMERGWGRPSVAGDYVYDYPHQLGTMRTGPDLLNVGARLPSAEWHYLHLYQPRAVADWSVMPSYPYLFEHKAEAGPDDVVVRVPEAWQVADGVVVAGPEAVALVTYLLALDRTMPALPAPEQP